MRKLLLFVLLFLHNIGAAQKYDPDAQQKGFTQLEQSGKLVRIVATPRNNEMTLEIFGNEAAGVTLKGQEVEARYVINGEERKLTLNPEKKSDGKSQIYHLRKLPTPVEKLKIDVNTSKGRDTVEISPPQ